MAAEPGSAPTPSRGEIHDIGYRHYDGPRLGERYIQRSLFVESLKGAYGFGRSARSKVMPLLLLAVMSLPAIVMVIVTSVVGLSELPTEYTEYPISMQIAISIFLGAQAPALVSRDLRFRVVSLYFARPLGRQQYVLAKYAAMATALFVLIALPLTILFLGALLAELPLGEQLPDYLRSLGAAFLYALVLGGIGLLIAALTPRRGLGVAAVVAALLVLAGLQATVQALGQEFDQETFAGYAGLLSPFSLVDGVVSTVLGGESSVLVGPPGAVGAAVFVAVAVLVVAGSYAALVARYRKVSVS
jgi:ABC-2 type transport system permease protein